MRKWFKRGPSSRRRTLPDFKSLHTRWLFGLGSLLTALALLALTVLYAQEKRTAGQLAAGRAGAVARSVSAWMNGDTHAKLVEEYAVDSLADREQAPRELVEMCDALRRTAASNGLDGRIFTVRLKDGLQQLVAAEPQSRHVKALEVILTNEDRFSWRQAIDYVPEMAPAFFESEGVGVLSRAAEGMGRGYAPVLDTWDAVVAVTVVESKAEMPVSGLLLRGSIAVVATGALLFLVLKVLGFFLRRHCDALTGLAEEAERLVADHRIDPVTTSASSRELVRLANALEASRVRSPAPAAAAPAAHAAAPGPAPATNGRAARNGRHPAAQPQQTRRPDPTASLPGTTFDVPLLIDQAVEPSRQKALQKELELRIIVGEKVPQQVESDPASILTALTSLLENALRYTREGAIAVQINRVVDADQLRFEVRDTGVGVAWKTQPRLTEVLELARGQDPADARPGLQRTAAIVARLGGELGFDSQPGSGTRFWFTAPYNVAHPAGVEMPEPALPVASR